MLAHPDPSAWLVAVPALIAGAGIGAGAAMLFVRRRWRTPVEQLTRVAADLAAGQWDRRTAWAPEASFEVRRLAEQVDRVAEAAQARLVLADERSANLKLLVDALPDPILVSDALDRVLLINAPAERLLNLPPQQVIGRPVVAAVNDLAILDLFEACRRRGDGSRPVDREIRLLRRGQRLLFQSHAERTPRGGTLVVLRDVSTLATTLQMKTDFVANASHELRTPISAIKAAFETLREVWRDEDPTFGERCVTIIDGHLQRLEEMLRDLLDLSRVENPDLKPTFEPVAVGELSAVLRSNWAQVAAERKVELALPETPDATFISDRRLLDLVLKNLVENALKFTPAGGRVTVTIEPAADVVRLAVADTGVGIPAEHAERVFERFYQVDAARSGMPGRGTGLGLAIVKHAVGSLGGQVRLASRMGEGTTVTIELPQQPAE